jgi:NAD(P)-dependent dehydrogenase (short-subunit alcohol dehydrogenase family)
VTGRLTGRRILVTGGANGIGLAVARMFCAEGARVAVLDRDAPTSSLDAVAVVADVADVAQVDAAVAAAAERLGGLDGIVNSAGIDQERPLAETSAADWARVIAVNLNGPMHVCRAAIPHLKDAGEGTIVNIASAAGLTPLMHRTAYCASKAGLVMFGKTLAIELAPSIRVNAVCPGAVETALFRASYENRPDAAAHLQRIRERYLLRRVAAADEIAHAVLYLTGHESAYVTGAALAVDGGRSFH